MTFYRNAQYQKVWVVCQDKSILIDSCNSIRKNTDFLNYSLNLKKHIRVITNTYRKIYQFFPRVPSLQLCRFRWRLQQNQIPMIHFSIKFHPIFLKNFYSTEHPRFRLGLTFSCVDFWFCFGFGFGLVFFFCFSF